MRIINVAPLIPGRAAELAEVLLRLERDGGVTDVAFMMPLQPETFPPAVKVARFRDLFLEMRQALSASRLRTGILLQTLIGCGDHGQNMPEPVFRRIITLEGKESNRTCPLDRALQDYVRQTLATLAGAGARFFIVDDSTRLFAWNAIGCFCPDHLSALNRLVGRPLSAGELAETLKRDDPAARRIGEAWDRVLLDSLLDLARAVRGGIDSVDPAIPCGYNCSVSEIAYAEPIALALAGQTRPFVRVNSSYYQEGGYKPFPRVMCQTAMQAAYLPRIPEILAEADTWPQHRYSESARTLHGQIAASLLNGVTDVLLWITRMHDFEPECGREYRRMLQAHRGFYREFTRLLPRVSWREPSSPFPAVPASSWNPLAENKQVRAATWAGDLLGRLGIPCRFGGASSVAMLTGQETGFFSDAELRRLLAGGLLLDGAAAEQFCRRGLSEHLGVEAEETRMRVSYERLADDPLLNGGAAEREFRFGTARSRFGGWRRRTNG